MPETSFQPTKADKAPAEKRRSHHGGSAAPAKASGDAITKAVTELYGTIGVATSFLNQYDGLVIMAKAETMAQSLVAACKPYPEAWKVLQAIAKGNIWTILFVAHLGPMVAIAANHGMLDSDVPTKFGLPPAPPRAEREQESMGATMSPAEAAHYREAEQEQMAAYIREQVAMGAANGNGHAPMQSGPIGDAEAGAVRAAFTQDQIDRIRQDALRQALELQAQAAANPDYVPNPAHNPMGWANGGGM